MMWWSVGLTVRIRLDQNLEMDCWRQRSFVDDEVSC